MTRSNKQVVQGFFDDLTNARRFDLWDEYLSPDAMVRGAPYVGIGVGIDDSSGQEVVVTEVVSGSPAEGKLQTGDVLLRIEDGDRVISGFDQLRLPIWGQGKAGTKVKFKLRRKDEDLDIVIERGVIKGFDLAYDSLKDLIRSVLEKDWPDLTSSVECLVEEGDLVSALVTNRGLNTQFNQRAIWWEFDLFRIQDGKIVEFWGLEDLFTQYKQLGYAILPPEK